MVVSVRAVETEWAAFPAGNASLQKRAPMPRIGLCLGTYPVSVGFALLAALASSAVLAQPVFPPGPTFLPGLSQDDVDRMNAAAARLYEGRSIGTVERWRSPSSNNAGEVKLIRTFEAHGMPCRTIDYTIRLETARASPEHYVINWCRVPGGTWKIVELAQPR